VKDPQEALAAARRAAAARETPPPGQPIGYIKYNIHAGPGSGSGPTTGPGSGSGPTSGPGSGSGPGLGSADSARRLAEWAIIEPEEDEVRSTRRHGRPITAVKLLLVRLLRQHIGQITAQQSRFNAQVAAHVVRLEERVAELEEIVRRDRERRPGPGAPPPP
jgi:hypothetical protein